LLSRFPACTPGGALWTRPRRAAAHAHAAEERAQRDLDAERVGEAADHAPAVERDHARARRAGEVLGEEAAARAERVAGVGQVEVDPLDAHLEHVAPARRPSTYTGR
jgi:hypothetical protein